MKHADPVNRNEIFLPANLFDHRTQHINKILLNDPDLFNFFSRSPMLPISDECKALSAFARLEQHIVGPYKMSFPGNGFGKRRFVKNIIVGESSGEDQVVGCIWPASDELEVHISFV